MRDTAGPDKILEYDALFERTDEPRIVMMRPGRNGMYKHASSAALDYGSTIQSMPGRHVVLVLAMSASEFYGPNKNGDGFSEGAIYGANNKCLVAEHESLPKHHHTFEQMGNVFTHHVNKDPERNYGRILKSFYNYGMHRVELMLEIDERKAAGEFFLHKIEQGEYPGVSMGCKIKYDVCNICGNKAPTRAQYCNHVNNMDPEYGMNRLLSDGQRCFVWNPSPGLFDISFVWKPADQLGYMMKKVAHDVYAIRGSRVLGERVQWLGREKSALAKLSEIDKVIHGDVANTTSTSDASIQAALKQFQQTPACSMDPVTNRAAAMCAPYDVRTIVNSMCMIGMAPTAKDMFRILSAKQGLEPDPAYEAVAGAMQSALVELFEENPHLMEELMTFPGADLHKAPGSPELANKLAEEMPGRALFVDKFMRENVPESYGMPLGTALGLDPTKAYYGDTRRPLTYVNPEDGKEYQTNRHAAELADTANKKRLAVEAAGAAGLLGVAYKSMTASGKLKYLQPAALGGAGIIGYDMVRGQRVPRVKTQEGEYVPLNTEFVEKRSGIMHNAVMPLGTGAIATYMLSQDTLNNPEMPALQSANAFAQENPVLTTLGAGTLAANLRDLSKAGLTQFRKRASLITSRSSQVSLNDVIDTMMSTIETLVP